MKYGTCKTKVNKKCGLLYFFIYIMLFIECYFGTRSFSFTRDGGFTFGIIHKSFFDIIKLTSLDVHPFLYYFIAKVFISPFHNIFIQIISLRILSSLPYLFLLIISNTTIKHKFGTKVSLIFMFLILTMPIVNNYVFVLRMYSMAMMFTTCAFLMFVYIYEGYLVNSFKPFIMISIFSLLASYSHYYSLLISIIMYITFFILFLSKGRKVRYLIYSSLIDVILYMPWIFILIKQVTGVKHGFWDTPITVNTVIINILNLACPLHGMVAHIIPILIITLIGIIFFIYHGYRNLIIDAGFIIGLSLILVSVILSVLVHHSVLQSRYLVPVMGIIWFSVALLINDMHTNQLKNILFMLLILTGSINYLYNLSQLHISANQYNNTIKNIELLPKRSTIIYNGDLPNYISSYHLFYNVYLTDNHSNLYNDNTKVYCKVYDMTSKDSINFRLPKESYFLKVNKRSSLGHHFQSKYKMNRIKYLYLPNDSGSKLLKCILYKVY